MDPPFRDYRPSSSAQDRYSSGCNPTPDMPPPAGRRSYDALEPVRNLERSTSQLHRAPSTFQASYSPSSSGADYGILRSPSNSFLRPNHSDRPQTSSSMSPWAYEPNNPFLPDRMDYTEKDPSKRNTSVVSASHGDEKRSKRNRGGRDEFDGSIQYLEKPRRDFPDHRERDLPHLPIHLEHREQDDVLTQVNKRLSQCAFDFVALYRFPIPLEPNKPAVQTATDKEWTEWAYLLKRLATKRKIPSHAVYNGQIKELTTVLDNSLEMRHATKPRERPLKDDRNVLQFISAGIQVGRILKDAATMEDLDKLYQQTECKIQERAAAPSYST
ncbi:hypothetical protein P7C71_g1554, partial [Lecanoromycetidae sp. Uapishka_2]